MLASSLARIVPGLARVGLSSAGSASLRGQAGEALACAFTCSGRGHAPSFAGAWFSSLPHPQQQQQSGKEAKEGQAQPPDVSSAGAAATGAAGGASAGEEPTPARPAGPASRRDKSAAADTVYASSKDDNMGVQRNWFNALFSQVGGLVGWGRGRVRATRRSGM